MASNFVKSLRRAISVLKCFNADELELSGTEISGVVERISGKKDVSLVIWTRTGGRL